jgi:hypothetical protein
MTRQRFDEHSTEFGLWLRDQKDIDSNIGYVATNIDYMWENYKTKEWMLIEEKRFCGNVTWCQNKMFEKIDNACKSDKNYKGFHILQFENKSPIDGKMWLDKHEINIEELIWFLQFLW